MPKIPASFEKTVRVRSAMSEVYEYFHDATKRGEDAGELEKIEKVGDDSARWVLEEKSEKGVTFKPDYTIKYSGNGSDSVSWRSVKGNIDVEGSVKLRSIDANTTEVIYKETMAPDLPINRIIAKVFKPIIARNVRSGLEEFLEKFSQRFGKA